MSNPNNRVRVRYQCRGSHEAHELCIELNRGVPRQLRCADEQGPGFSTAGGGGGCTLPKDLPEQVNHTLRQDVEKWKHLGYVEITA